MQVRKLARNAHQYIKAVRFSAPGRNASQTASVLAAYTITVTHHWAIRIRRLGSVLSKLADSRASQRSVATGLAFSSAGRSDNKVREPLYRLQYTAYHNGGTKQALGAGWAQVKCQVARLQRQLKSGRVLASERALTMETQGKL